MRLAEDLAIIVELTRLLKASPEAQSWKLHLWASRDSELVLAAFLEGRLWSVDFGRLPSVCFGDSRPYDETKCVAAPVDLTTTPEEVAARLFKIILERTA